MRSLYPKSQPQSATAQPAKKKCRVTVLLACLQPATVPLRLSALPLSPTVGLHVISLDMVNKYQSLCCTPSPRSQRPRCTCSVPFPGVIVAALFQTSLFAHSTLLRLSTFGLEPCMQHVIGLHAVNRQRLFPERFRRGALSLPAPRSPSRLVKVAHLSLQHNGKYPLLR